MFNSTNIYTKEYEHGRTSMIYDRSTISGWTVEVINMYDEEQFVGIFRTTLRDGKECEQFTLLPSRYSDDTFIQIRIYKNGDVLVYGLVPVKLKVLETITAESKEDALKYAYAFMVNKTLNMKECSFINADSTQSSKAYLFPRDIFSITYTDNAPDWALFKNDPTHLSSAGFSCVGCLDTKDKMRVNLSLLNNTLTYVCYGNYENTAKEAFAELVSFHTNLD